MLKIWHLSSIWPNKVNFIDDQNTILGYDLASCCCEHAFWYITEDAAGYGQRLYEGDESTRPFEIELNGFRFDNEYFDETDEDGENGHVVFRLVSKSLANADQVLFIHLKNHQNGYYSHGFSFASEDKVISKYI